MTNRQQNKLKSYQTRSLFLQGTIATWQSNKPFATGVADVENALGNVLQLTQERQAGNGLAIDKHAVRITMINAALPVAGEVASYAHRIKNNDLLAKSDYKESELTLARDNDCLTECKNILGAATANLAVMTAEGYNITAIELADLEHKCDAFGKVLATPQEKQKEDKALTETIAAAFDTVDEIYEQQLDKLVLRFQKTNPDFVAKYFNARQIVDTAATHDSGTPTNPPAPATPAK